MVEPESTSNAHLLQSDEISPTARKAYWELIQSTTTTEFSGFAKSLREQDEAARERGRALAIQFLPDGRTMQIPFSDSQSLQQYLDSVRDPFEPSKRESKETRPPLRHMIILEDMPRNHVEILGSRLKIHPAIFAAHWNDPIPNRHRGTGLVLNKSSRRYFVLQSPQMHYIDVEDEDLDVVSSCFYLDSSVRRSIIKGTKDSDDDLSSQFGEFWNVVSFWSVGCNDGGWTAVLLVDPPFGDHVRHSLTNKLHKIQIHEGDAQNACKVQYHSLVTREELSNNIADWPSLQSSQPSMVSVLDEISNFYLHNLHDIGDSPISSTAVVNQIILSMWIGFLDRMRVVLSNTHTRLWSDSFKYEWSELSFMNLATLKIDVEDMLLLLYRNMKALRVNMSRPGEDGILADWEVEEWRFVETRLVSLKRSVNDILQVYTEAISVGEARSSNIVARSVARLTALATVFVPLSIVATVFSMSGAYAVGESRFWVFFVITIPILIIISLIIFSNIASAAWKNICGCYLLTRDIIKGAYSYFFRRTSRLRNGTIWPQYYKNKALQVTRRESKFYGEEEDG